MMNKHYFLLCSFFPHHLYANVADSAVTSSEPITSAYMAKFLLSLVLVLGIIFLLAWLVKRLNVIPQQNKGAIQLLASLPMSAKDRLALIQVGEEQILISVSPGRMSKLHCLEKPLDMTSFDTNGSSSFSDKMQAILQQSANQQAAKNKKSTDEI